MNDDFLRNKIKQSAENLDVPNSLKPDNVQKSLEKSSTKIRRFPSRLFTSAAVAVLVLFVGIFALNHITQNSIMDGDDTERSLELTEESAIEQSSSLQPISNYSELYKTLKTYEQESYIVYEEEMVEENVAESSAADSSSLDMTTSQNTSSEDYSSTNLRTEGVDEGDIVKTDGTYLYILSSNRGISIVNAASMKLVKKIPLENKG